MNHPKISVIVPVYNARKYLRHCVDSILAQSFSDFELLLIDDGSTDNSRTICDEYASNDSRIHVFHKPNGGVSSARNFGLDCSKGEYIIFIDADDFWLDESALSRLFEIVSSNDLDIVRGEYISVDCNEQQLGTPDVINKLCLENTPLNNIRFLREAIDEEFYLVLCLIRKEAISNLRFDTDKVFLEDMKFYMCLLSVPLKCGYSHIPFYAYRKISTSASNTVSIKKLSDSFDMCDFYWNLGNSSNLQDFKEYCYYHSVMTYYWTLQTVASPEYFNNRTSIIQQLELDSLQKQTKERAGMTYIKAIYKLFIYCKPRLGVLLLFIKDRIAEKLKK